MRGEDSSVSFVFVRSDGSPGARKHEKSQSIRAKASEVRQPSAHFGITKFFASRQYNRA